MTRKIDRDSQTELRLGPRVNRKVLVLLNEIEKEPVPDRLLALAQDLQKALAEKLDRDR